MTRNLMLYLILYLVLAILEDVYTERGIDPWNRRHNMIKFAIYQDLLVALSILKMIVLEGYTLCGVMQRIRSAGPMTHLYIATTAVLHGALLIDEKVDHRLRLKPVPYLPPQLDEDQKDLFLV